MVQLIFSNSSYKRYLHHYHLQGCYPLCPHQVGVYPHHVVSLTKYYKYIETLHVKIIYCCTCIVYMYMYCGGRYLMNLIQISFAVLPDINLVVFTNISHRVSFRIWAKGGGAKWQYVIWWGAPHAQHLIM